MNFLINRIIFNKSEAALKFMILKNKYLIPVKPKKNLSSYLLFAQDRREAYKDSPNILETTAKIGAQWKLLPEEQKKKYEEKSKILSEQHKKIIDEYEEKFVTPFKNINIANLGIKKLFEGVKGTTLEETAPKVKEFFEKLSAEEKKKLQEEVDKIKKEREQIAKDYLIPEAQYKTQRSFLINKLKQKKGGKKTLSEVSDKTKEELKSKYAEYIKDEEKAREQFAKKHGITIGELNEIISLNKRKLKRESASTPTIAHLNPPVPSPKKRATKKTAKKVKTQKVQSETKQ